MAFKKDGLVKGFDKKQFSADVHQWLDNNARTEEYLINNVTLDIKGENIIGTRNEFLYAAINGHSYASMIAIKAVATYCGIDISKYKNNDMAPALAANRSR